MDVQDAVPQHDRTGSLPTLAARVPAQAVMTQLLTLHRQAPPRSGLARAFGLDPLDDERGAWFRGALGEVAVGKALTKLPAGWHVLHAVPVGRDDADIDHVVIGPGGVYTVNTKNHSGQKVWVAGRTFMVNGQKQPHVRNAEHEAGRAARLLSSAAVRQVEVVPLVVVVDPASLTVRERPDKVVVLTSNQLVRWLRKQPDQLSAQHVAVLARVAADPGVWHSQPAPSLEPSAVQAAFAVLRDEVRRARTVRQAWALTALGVSGTIAATAGPAALESLLTSIAP